MESPSLVRPPIFFALLIAILSLTAVWLISAFLLPKAEFFLATSPPYEPVPMGGSAVLGSHRRIAFATWGGVLLTALLGLGALLPQLSGRFRRGSAWALHGLAVLLFVSTLYLSLITFLGAMWANMSMSRKLTVFRRELEVFALTEAAENRFEQFNELFARASTRRLRVVQSEDEMTPAERRNRVVAMVDMLNLTPNSRARRRVLATLPLFRQALSERPGLHAGFLRHAKELSSQEFADMDALLTWLLTAPKEDGWEPLPIQIIE